MSYVTKITGAAAVALTIAFSPLSSIADDGIEKAIDARQSLMKLYGINIGQLAAMAKGQMDCDAEKAKTVAENLHTLATMKASVVWPQGSDSTAYPKKSRAKVEAWSTYPAIMEHQKALIEATSKMVSAAGNGREEMAAGLGGIGKSCGACHKLYREPM